ncbi:hypothetical protein [Loktanella sp. Alg231-35]|uniref:hypothetical protein n=1 Tax=Loktanella sp. Alg231-35 TaxID=1922220 RepID=UPI00131F1311|nr:hypothetical protein [Loktanella sp. Alg231-35]
MDLAGIASVIGFPQGLNGGTTKVDRLTNNAGIMTCPEARVGPVWGSQFSICHWGILR